MSLYICPKCHAKFNEPFREHYDDGALKESYDTCPDCGNPDFEEAAQCRGCRKDIEYSKLIAGEYCPDCVEYAVRYCEDLVYGYLSLDDVRENFAEFLAERQWRPLRKRGKWE